jgi:two-component system CheB/CheR fusion protein
LEINIVGNVVKFGSEEQLLPISFLFNEMGELIQSCRHNKAAIERLEKDINQPGVAMTLGELYAATHTALKEARRSNMPVVRRGVSLGQEGDTIRVDVIVEPVEYGPQGRVFLVMMSGSEADSLEREAASTESKREEAGEEARQLHEMRERFRRHVTFYKRLVEKARSSYEELRTVGMELNAAKHALRILSEQLGIANVELGSKISEIGSVESELPEVGDLRPIAVLLLDRKLVLRSFSLTAEAPFSLSSLDNGRALAESLASIPGADGLLREIRAVTKSGLARDHELKDPNGGTRCLVQILPHRDAAGRLDGGLALFFQNEETSEG